MLCASQTLKSFTFGRTTKNKLVNYLSSSNKWKEFCKGKEVIKEFIASFDNEEDQVALEYWYNHYVYPDNLNCWSRKSPSIVIANKISEAKKGKPSHRKGTKLSTTTKMKMSIALTGNTHSEETKIKMSKSHLGKPKSEETKNRMSEANKGKIFSEETKAKMSESARNRQKNKCPRCGRRCSPGNYARWHGDKCKLNKYKDKFTLISKYSIGKIK